MTLTVLGITLSGSRTGLIGVVVLAVWGLLDRRLSRFSRGLLLAAPLLCAASVGLTSWWADLQGVALIGAAARVGQADLSSSRFAIWRDALALIQAQPWLGVGFGEFNFAWTLTPLPNRPTEFFDHTHNLPLQLAAELGLPLAGLVLGLLVWSLWQAWRHCSALSDETGAPMRAAFVMVLMMALHSLLEYPLWYAHFLLPTGLIAGLCLGAGAGAQTSAGSTGLASPNAHSRRPRWPVAAGLVLSLAAIAVVADFRRCDLHATRQRSLP
jgi:O-antigen ligase